MADKIYTLPKQFHPDFVNPRKKPVGPVEVDWADPINRELRAHYLMQEGFGETARDLAKGQSAAMNSTNATWTTVGGRRSIRITGTNTSCNVSDNPNLAITEAITVCGWVYLTLSTAGRYPCIADKNRTEAWSFIANYGGSSSPRIILDLSGRKDFTYPAVINDNQWYFYAFTYDRITVRGYLDGDEVSLGTSSPSQTAAIGTTTADMAIGAEMLNSSVDVDHNVDNVRVFARALSAGEIKILYLDEFRGLKPAVDMPYIVPVAAGGLSIPIAAYHYNHNLGSNA